MPIKCPVCSQKTQNKRTRSVEHKYTPPWLHTPTTSPSVFSVVSCPVRTPLRRSLLPLRRLSPSLPESESICLPSLPTRPAASSSSFPHSPPGLLLPSPPCLTQPSIRRGGALSGTAAAGGASLSPSPLSVSHSLLTNLFQLISPLKLTPTT